MLKSWESWLMILAVPIGTRIHQMKLGVYLEMLIMGIPVGLLVLGLLAGEERSSLRLQVMRWCARAGVASVLIFGVEILFPASGQSDREPVRMALIGLPAFSTAAILFMYDRLSGAFKRRKAANSSSLPKIDIGSPGVGSG